MTVHAKWVLVLLLAAGATRAQAQEYPLAPLVARLPGGTRALAMANADMGGRGSDVMFYNPAQLAVARGTAASAQFYTHGDLLAGFSTVMTMGGGSVGVGVQSLTFSAATPGYASPGELGADDPLASSGLVLAAGYARSLFGFRVGANAKMLQQQIGTLRDTRGSLDAGVSHELWRGTAGLSVQNLGPALRAYPGLVSQPSRANLGYTSGRYEAGPLDLSAAATASALRGRTFVAGGGGEVSYSWLDGYAVAAQAGVRRAAEGEGPWTAGVSVSADRFTLEYAFESRRDRAGAHRVGIRIQ